jgi:hypothetical protein
MSLRSRVLTVLNGQKPEKVPWLGDLSYWISYLNQEGIMPEKYKAPNGEYELYRDLGVGYYLQGYFPFKTLYEGIEAHSEKKGDTEAITLKTPVGSVTIVWKQLPGSYTWGPQEHFVKDINDLKVIRYLYEHIHYEPDYKEAQDRYEAIGDNGLVLCYLPKSPFMEMVTQLAGIEVATYLLMDYPDEFEAVLNIMSRKVDEAAQIAVDSPAECLMIPENLSSELVGKRMFKKYMRAYEEKWIKRIKEAGKYSFIHMDGTLRGLIKEVASTGFNVLEALTPAPVGDIPFEEIRNWTGEDTIIWGGIPGVYFTDLISDRDFDVFVMTVLEVMENASGYVLGVADQVPPGASWERVKRVSELVELYG